MTITLSTALTAPLELTPNVPECHEVDAQASDGRCSRQEAGQPSRKQNVPTTVSICFGRHPDIDEVTCSTRRVNPTRLLQSCQEGLNVVYKSQQEQPYRPEDIFEPLVSAVRKLY
jgi:hypothetical protein